MHRSTVSTRFSLLMVSALLVPSLAGAQGGADRKNLPSIVVSEATKRDLVDRVVATGTLKPVDEIYVQPLVDGLSVDKLNVDIGDKVEAGASLAELSKDSLILQKSQLQANRAKAEATVAQSKAQVIEAQANYDDAVRQRDRADRLGKSGSGSVSQVEQTAAAADVAQARLQASRQNVTVGEAEIKVVDAQIEDIDLKLSRTSVKTPVAGIVSARNARVGAIASGSGDPLFTVIKDNAIELVADLSETDIQKVQAGQRAIITVAGGRNKIEGKVRLVSPTVDATTRLGSVHILLPADSPARAGMYGSAEVVIASANALALPLSAVTSGRDGSSTRRVEDGIVRQVAVEIGIQDKGFVEIKSGISAGDMVVEKAGAFVRDGDKINPVPADAAASN
ncbi:efflux RND transporter periplasmic adaptor subunit [Agrobacterium rubi]|uniref:Efflux RND transporter periplasmic adaptor subunit n=1 Tax=Agrobacterium rubi TaxID=28099 RepID=A0AAE7QZV8_9HYPH|nr:efflux RND transporter periplasmic adaptor subunit [Agrobacterium rubi]NTE87088.1 efflux RND transporter periplasmic adaptor subunit [Agrobacterium rubi]NTF03022.1 efflux RND transporter periplasmic adaptor subunit [Agrobacterium rubi]NTF37266.1 efflux RND transporter periplasmic adaptor subunit [Agrobacterium rubi]OCJ55167.1 efflux transporter periplasmic adaptor subunit [Agrobacterium rubi]QTF99687.1 efflux RND transporter periplasmic adaptor subunit [Agrobacterium rubi]